MFESDAKGRDRLARWIVESLGSDSYHDKL